ncbi:DUF3135 domain-containing protein [Shewanella sp. MBTL60-112-B1]|nr:DUF3135 domain-containing protein [Shewanella sp. MBTL60-112-B1]GIU08132.1 hypothetical protein TUM4444_08720 [Shewanella sp. MBTL60-112-B1]GIU40660.1 hypothetical protein TUM4445_40270 [Shewanella sp. MBTL60-112-B2]
MTELPSFDRLLWMAENTPEKLDALQKRLSKETIAQSSEHNRANLTSLLDHINKRLALCKTPYQRCHLMSSLMFQKLTLLNQAYCQPEQFLQNKAEVVHLRKNTR